MNISEGQNIKDRLAKLEAELAAAMARIAVLESKRGPGRPAAEPKAA